MNEWNEQSRSVLYKLYHHYLQTSVLYFQRSINQMMYF